MQNSNQGWAGWEGASVDLQLTEEQELLLKSVREFAEREVRPLAKELDETGRFPRELFKKAAELGLTGVPFPESEGGAGFDHIAYTIVIEEISRCCASTGVILSVQNSLYCDPLHRYGTEEQKKKFLLPYARGEKIGCYALTEPQAGSNAAALQTKAVKKGDAYVLNGTKAWITNGGAADAAIVYVNTEPAKGEKGITALVVERGTPGFQVGKEEKKLGINATACSELVFTDCVVPATNRIGSEGEGYKVALSTLDGGLPQRDAAEQRHRRPRPAPRDGRRHRAGRVRSRLEIFPGAHGVWPPDFAISSYSIHAGGHVHGN